MEYNYDNLLQTSYQSDTSLSPSSDKSYTTLCPIVLNEQFKDNGSISLNAHCNLDKVNKDGWLAPESIGHCQVVHTLGAAVQGVPLYSPPHLGNLFQ